MKTNQIIRELRNIDRKTFTTLNTLFGYDFEKPFTTAKINGAFTINRIWKEIEKKHSADDSMVVALMVADNVNSWRKHTITRILSNNIDIDFRMGSTDSRVWDSFFAKGDFHELRKKAKCVYIIAQKKELANAVTRNRDKNRDMSQRYPLTGETPLRWCKTYGGEDYISNIYLKDIYHNGERFAFHPSYALGNPPRTESEVIDKSGYIVINRRYELKRRANKLRAEREAARFKATDNAAIIRKVAERVTALRDSICKALSTATTSERINDIHDLLSSWRGLGGVCDSFERLEQGEKEKKFASIADFNKALASLNERIDSVNAAMIEKGVTI